MKKKVKLFSTIASLCLAVALMAFGVWAAAGAAKFATNSTVSFKATTAVFGTFEAKVALGEEVKHTITATKENVNNGDWAVTAGEVEKTALMGDGAALGDALALTQIGDKYTFTYSFENTSPYTINYKVTTDLANSIKQVGNTEQDAITVVDVTNKTGTIAKGAKEIWTVTVELKSLDLAKDENLKVNFVVNLDKDAIA
ncbi:MAG: hypothetical protein MR904_03695 [Clostridia bacterium]|nr:hypothetical protein [Clostridia bacterium]